MVYSYAVNPYMLILYLKKYYSDCENEKTLNTLHVKLWNMLTNNFAISAV